MQQTLTSYRLGSSIARWLETRFVGPQLARNPFEVAHSLDELRQQLVQLESQCNADRQAHAEAARAVAGAERQLQAAEQLVRQSQTDGIPDSKLSCKPTRRIAALTRSLGGSEARFGNPARQLENGR